MNRTSLFKLKRQQNNHFRTLKIEEKFVSTKRNSQRIQEIKKSIYRLSSRIFKIRNATSTFFRKVA